MLLCEQERILTAERNLLTNNNTYNNGGTTLTLIHDYGNIVLAQDSLVYLSALIKLTVVNPDPNPQAIAEFILKIGARTVAGKRLLIQGSLLGVPSDATISGIIGCLIYLSAGTYDVSIYALSDYIDNTFEVDGLSIGVTSFNDLMTSALQTITTGTTNITLTVAARKTPLGPLNQAVYAINIASTVEWGSGLSVSVDGVPQTVPDEDALTDETGLYVYKHYIPLAAGVSHTVAVTLTSGTAYLSVVACPWILTILSHVHSPVTLDFSQNSTLYAKLGSLFYDAYKAGYIGSLKGVTFGANDYYDSQTTANGVLHYNYTFTTVNVAGASWVLDGLGGCVDNLGADIT
jgi:hypothetical protein